MISNHSDRVLVEFCNDDDPNIPCGMEFYAQLHVYEGKVRVRIELDGAFYTMPPEYFLLHWRPRPSFSVVYNAQENSYAVFLDGIHRLITGDYCIASGKGNELIANSVLKSYTSYISRAEIAELIPYDKILYADRHKWAALFADLSDMINGIYANI